MSEGSVTDGTLAESETQAAAIWRVREGITESLVKRGESQSPHRRISVPKMNSYPLDFSDLRTAISLWHLSSLASLCGSAAYTT